MQRKGKHDNTFYQSLIFKNIILYHNENSNLTSTVIKPSNNYPKLTISGDPCHLKSKYIKEVMPKEKEKWFWFLRELYDMINNLIKKRGEGEHYE